MKTKSKFITGACVLVAVGAVALGGVSMANAATPTSPATAVSATPVAHAAATPSAAPSARSTPAPSTVASTPTPTPTPSPTSCDGPLTYTALPYAEGLALWNADVAQAAALTPAQRHTQFLALIAEAKPYACDYPSDAAGEKLSIEVKAFATTQ